MTAIFLCFLCSNVPLQVTTVLGRLWPCFLKERTVLLIYLLCLRYALRLGMEAYSSSVSFLSVLIRVFTLSTVGASLSVLCFFRVSWLPVSSCCHCFVGFSSVWTTLCVK